MDVLAENKSKIYGAITIDNPIGFSSPFSGALFACLIWDHEGRFSDLERREVATALLEAGCRYAVCGGENCEAWHDAVDMDFVKRHMDDPEHVRDAEHVMTTWHDCESPDDVAFFFVFNTNFGTHDFASFLVLHVGSSDAKEQVEIAIRKYVRSKQAV